MAMTTAHVATLLTIGFSIGAAAILLVAYLFFLDNMQKTGLGKTACACLLAALSGLQLFHLAYLLFDAGNLFADRVYVMLLLTAPPAFYFFSRELLIPEPNRSPWQSLHLAPVMLGAVLPVNTVIVVALTIGAGYSIWFARIVYGLRRNVRRFRFEMFFFGFFALVAILVLMLFILVPYLDDAVFYLAYANLTGVAFLFIVAVLILYPEVLDDITDIARMTYSKSTLGEIDVDAKIRELERAMQTDRLYQNENLTLKATAEAVGLTGHQLSELVNSHFGSGFSRYVREHRVREARRMLREDREASVLAISLATGFRSQSNFYAAFKEIVGVSPGQYRESPD